jgi:hypothetical protein
MVLTGNLHTYQTHNLTPITAQSLGLNSSNPEEGGSMLLCNSGVITTKLKSKPKFHSSIYNQQVTLRNVAAIKFGIHHLLIF